MFWGGFNKANVFSLSFQNSLKGFEKRLKKGFKRFEANTIQGGKKVLNFFERFWEDLNKRRFQKNWKGFEGW
jgi:hypothetical protein